MSVKSYPSRLGVLAVMLMGLLTLFVNTSNAPRAYAEPVPVSVQATVQSGSQVAQADLSVPAEAPAVVHPARWCRWGHCDSYWDNRQWGRGFYYDHDFWWRGRHFWHGWFDGDGCGCWQP
jgi:hypothetical protein